MVQRSRSGSGGHGGGMYMNVNGDGFPRASSAEDGRQVKLEKITRGNLF